MPEESGLVVAVQGSRRSAAFVSATYSSRVDTMMDSWGGRCSLCFVGGRFLRLSVLEAGIGCVGRHIIKPRQEAGRRCADLERCLLARLTSKRLVCLVRAQAARSGRRDWRGNTVVRVFPVVYVKGGVFSGFVWRRFGERSAACYSGNGPYATVDGRYACFARPIVSGSEAEWVQGGSLDVFRMRHRPLAVTRK